MNTIMLSNKEFSGKTVVALGKFDGIHTGHARLLECAAAYAAKEGALSLVYVMEPESGSKLTQADEKTKLISSFGIDALAIEPLTKDFMNMAPEAFVSDIIKNKLNACHVVVGYNFRFGKNRVGDTKLLEKCCKKYGISVSVIDCVYGDEHGKRVAVSSSEIRRLASLGHVDDIAPLLGRNFSVSGVVEKGKMLGKTLSFPTANIYKCRHTFLLKHGVYVTKTAIDGKYYLSLTNVGTNPTLEKSDDKVRIETYIPDFEGDLYGTELTVEFLEYIREEKKFSDVEGLKSQLERDKEYLKNIAGR